MLEMLEKKISSKFYISSGHGRTPMGEGSRLGGGSKSIFEKPQSFTIFKNICRFNVHHAFQASYPGNETSPKDTTMIFGINMCDYLYVEIFRSKRGGQLQDCRFWRGPGNKNRPNYPGWFRNDLPKGGSNRYRFANHRRLFCRIGTDSQPVWRIGTEWQHVVEKSVPIFAQNGLQGEETRKTII